MPREWQSCKGIFNWHGESEVSTEDLPKGFVYNRMGVICCCYCLNRDGGVHGRGRTKTTFFLLIARLPDSPHCSYHFFESWESACRVMDRSRSTLDLWGVPSYGPLWTRAWGWHRRRRKGQNGTVVDYIVCRSRSRIRLEIHCTILLSSTYSTTLSCRCLRKEQPS